MKKNSKKVIIIFIISFLVALTLGIIFSYYLNTSYRYDLFFGSDTGRVVNDLTVRVTEHNRTTVHPLFVILVQPVVFLVTLLFKDAIFAAIFVQSVVIAASVVILYLILSKFKLNQTITYLLTAIFLLAFGQLVFACTLETYPFAQLFLLILFYFTWNRMDQELGWKDYMCLVILGVLSLGITITNIIPYIFCLFFLVFLNKENKKNLAEKIIYFINCLMMVGGVSVMLSELQAVIFPESPLFAYYHLSSVLSDQMNEETNYINRFSVQAVSNQINTVFGSGFIAPNIQYQGAPNYLLSFGSIGMIPFIIKMILIGLFPSAILLFLVKMRKNLKEHKFFLLLMITFLFHFILHIFYGNTESILYILHYLFIIILIIGYLLKWLPKRYRFVTIFLLGVFVLLELLLNGTALTDMFHYLSKDFERLTHIKIRIYCIYLISFILFLLCILKGKIMKLIAILLCVIACSFGYHIVEKQLSINSVNEEVVQNKTYSEELDPYLQQLSHLKEVYQLNEGIANTDSFYFFGMGNRRKLLYKDGYLMDLNTHKTLYHFEVEKEIMIPNTYKVVLELTDRSEIVIYENEQGVYIKHGDWEERIPGTEESVKLPSFEGNPYSEILKVLHQEILFNITDGKMTPNILAYPNAWYRDAMLGAMVLEQTGNTNLLEPWLDQITEIYDMQNGVEETDNLGELLYLLSFSKKDHSDLVNKVKREAERIMTETGKNYITGYTDGKVMSYYPTAILKLGLDKLSIPNTISLPEKEDPYAKLTWFYPTDHVYTGTMDSVRYPYLGWATYHHNQTSKLSIGNGIYPLSYEQDACCAVYSALPNELAYFKQQRIAPTHVWHASEMFLVLKGEI